MQEIKIIDSSSLPKIKPLGVNVIENRNNNRNRAFGVAKPDLDLPELISSVNQFVHSFSTKLSFHLDNRVRKPVIRVIDEDTGKVIRQIPPEQMIRQLKHFHESTGIIFQGKM